MASSQSSSNDLRLTGYAHGGGCACKIPPGELGEAVRSLTGEDDVPATSQLTVTYLRAGKPGRLAVVGRVSKQGEHLTVCEADVEQEGRTLVHAVATFAARTLAGRRP